MRVAILILLASTATYARCRPIASPDAVLASSSLKAVGFISRAVFYQHDRLRANVLCGSRADQAFKDAHRQHAVRHQRRTGSVMATTEGESRWDAEYKIPTSV